MNSNTVENYLLYLSVRCALTDVFQNPFIYVIFLHIMFADINECSNNQTVSICEAGQGSGSGM